MSEIENDLIFFRENFPKSALTGMRFFSIRKGRRLFGKHVTVRVLIDEERIKSFQAVIESTVVCQLQDVPFEILTSKGFNTIRHYLDSMRIVYPEISLDDVITIVGYRLEIPIQEVEIRADFQNS